MAAYDEDAGVVLDHLQSRDDCDGKLHDRGEHAFSANFDAERIGGLGGGVDGQLERRVDYLGVLRINGQWWSPLSLGRGGR